MPLTHVYTLTLAVWNTETSEYEPRVLVATGPENQNAVIDAVIAFMQKESPNGRWKMDKWASVPADLVV